MTVREAGLRLGCGLPRPGRAVSARKHQGWVAAWAGVLLMVVALPAQSQASAEPEGSSARYWLSRLQDAARSRCFEGTFVSGAGTRSSSSHIVHYSDGRNQYERVESLDGEMRIVYRHNELVQTVWPGTRTVVVEQRVQDAAFPALLSGSEARVAEYYEVGLIGRDRIAGFDAEVLRLMPKDAYRYGWRLWSEKLSGLLLRAEVLGSSNQVLEWSSFSNVLINPRPQPDGMQLPRSKLDGYRFVQSQVQAADMGKEGWSLQDAPPGFSFVRAVKRVPGDAESKSGVMPLLQAIYSDGVTFVSVFVEPYGVGQVRKEMLMTLGATHTLTRRQGDWWITVVGDVPAVTLRWFASRLQRVE